MLWKLARVAMITLLMLLSFFTGTAPAAQDEAIIRVGLSSPQLKVNFRVAEGGYSLIDAATNLSIAQPKPGQLWTIQKAGPNLKIYLDGTPLAAPYDGPIILAADEGELNIFSYNNTKYRDDLVAENRADGVLPVNRLPLEHYLYGVVGQEIGNTAAMEALKAQAVVSRSYALALRQTRGSYDVGVDTRTQVYRGYDAELLPGSEQVRRAVDETKGEVILYDGNIITAFFHSNAGGYTENSENVWQQELPYIKAVPSPYDIHAAQYNAQVDGWPQVTYSWSKTIDREELYSLVSQWNKAAETNEKLSAINVGSISDISISRLRRGSDQLTESGRVTKLTLSGDRGEAAVERDSIRTLLGLRSTLFDLKFNSSVSILSGSGQQVTAAGLSGMKAVDYSNRLQDVNGAEGSAYLAGGGSVRTVPKKFSEIYINGHGYGHGLGMSQWGARGMAEDGYKYSQIIQHYYNQGKQDGRLTISKIY